ncbi:TPA: hypothetical protein QIY66_000640 [Raoultella planticola]|nr:hypothetical protein [Raoultella planticola]
MADYNLLMKQRIANAWRDSKPLTPVVNDAQPVNDRRLLQEVMKIKGL